MDKNKFKRDEDITGLDETKNDDSANSSPVKKIKILDAASNASEIDLRKTISFQKEIIKAQKSNILALEGKNLVQDNLVSAKDENIKLLKQQLRTITTRLYSREGILHTRGIFEIFENQHSSDTQNKTRKKVWFDILNENTNSNFRRKVEKILDCYSTVDLVEKFLRMYSLLSTEVHNSLHTPEVLVITNKITLKYGKIIGEMCRELNVEFRYQDENTDPTEISGNKNLTSKKCN